MIFAMAMIDGSSAKVHLEFVVEIRRECGFYLVNPGWAGRPRDRNWRATYALYSPEEQRVEFERVPYNVGPTAEKSSSRACPPRSPRGCSWESDSGSTMAS